MQGPRIALILRSFPKLSEVFIVNVFLGLLERGADVHVVCAESNPEEWRWYEGLAQRPDARARVHVARERRRELDVLRSPLILLRCIAVRPGTSLAYLRRGARRYGIRLLRKLSADEALIRLRPDIVHFEFGTLAPKRIYLGESLGCRTLVSFRGYDINYAGLDNPDYYNEVWSHADAVHCNGIDLWRRCLARGCPPDMPHAEISPALGPAHFADESESDPLKGSSETLRLISVGRLEWKKGFEFALQAVKLLKDQGLPVTYEIVGAGSYREALEVCRSQLGLETCVQLTGALPPREVRERLLCADVFLHPAVSEGFPNVVLEAQAAGLPVVGTNADGLAENIEPGVTGLQVRSRDPEAMAAAVLELARDPVLRRQMGEAGRKRVQMRFRLEDQVSAFLALYQDLFAAAARRAR